MNLNWNKASMVLSTQRSKLDAAISQLLRVLLPLLTINGSDCRHDHRSYLTSPTQQVQIASKLKQPVPRNHTSNMLPSVSDSTSSLACSYIVSRLLFINAGMQCCVATGLSTVVSCSDLTGFSSDYFQDEVGLFSPKLSVAMVHFANLQDFTC